MESENTLNTILYINLGFNVMCNNILKQMFLNLKIPRISFMSYKSIIDTPKFLSGLISYI